MVHPREVEYSEKEQCSNDDGLDKSLNVMVVNDLLVWGSLMHHDTLTEKQATQNFHLGSLKFVRCKLVRVFDQNQQKHQD